MREGGKKKGKWKARGRRRKAQRWPLAALGSEEIFQKGNYKSGLETRGAAIKRDLYETRGCTGPCSRTEEAHGTCRDISTLFIELRNSKIKSCQSRFSAGRRVRSRDELLVKGSRTCLFRRVRWLLFVGWWHCLAGMRGHSCGTGIRGSLIRQPDGNFRRFGTLEVPKRFERASSKGLSRYRFSLFASVATHENRMGITMRVSLRESSSKMRVLQQKVR